MKLLEIQKLINECTEENKGCLNDGYHSFDELYEFRKLLQAHLLNEWAKQDLYAVHKSKFHSDGKPCFGGGWFIVMATLDSGQISNHYPIADWNIFQVPEKPKAEKWDEHSSQDVINRLRKSL